MEDETMACPAGIVTAPTVEALTLYKENAELLREVARLRMEAVELRQESEALRNKSEALRREQRSCHEELASQSNILRALKLMLAVAFASLAPGEFWMVLSLMLGAYLFVMLFRYEAS